MPKETWKRGPGSGREDLEERTWKWKRGPGREEACECERAMGLKIGNRVPYKATYYKTRSVVQ
jgi:hypothetical protein